MIIDTSQIAQAQELMEWLRDSGFNLLSTTNRPSEHITSLYSRKCETQLKCQANPEKEGQALYVEFSWSKDPLKTSMMQCTVSIRGQHNNLWWSFSSYSLDVEEVQGKLSLIEKQLIRAWESLDPKTKKQDKVK